MMTSFGTRLHTERKRLKLTQEAFAKLGGVERNAQSEYENDKGYPKADYLISLAGAQVDVVYLIYGERIDFTISQHAKELVAVLTELPPGQQALGFMMLNLFKRGAVAEQTLADSEKLWRGARLFEQFMAMPEAQQAMLEMTAQGLVSAGAV